MEQFDPQPIHARGLAEAIIQLLEGNTDRANELARHRLGEIERTEGVDE